MKPRLPSAGLTDEDYEIWYAWPRYAGWWDGAAMRECAAQQDCRDAALLLHLAQLRTLGTAYLRLKVRGVSWGNIGVPAVHVLVRKDPAWPPPGFDITDCA